MAHRKPLFIPADESIHRKLDYVNEKTGITKTDFVTWAVLYALQNWNISKLEEIKRDYLIFGDRIFDDEHTGSGKRVT